MPPRSQFPNTSAFVPAPDDDPSEDEVTGLGAPVMGDSSRCPDCGSYKDYVCEDVYMCIGCPGAGEDSEFDEDDDQCDGDEESPEPSVTGPADAVGHCIRCNKNHDWSKDEFMNCIPPQQIRRFGDYTIDHRYRQALYAFCSTYRTEDVVGSFLGHNPTFPSQETWLRVQEHMQRFY